MRRLLARLGADGQWARRLAWTIIGYVVLVVALSLFGFSPAVALLGVFAVAAFSIVVLVADRLPDASGDRWPLLRASNAGTGRGSDHRTTALASRLSTMPTAGHDRRLALATTLQHEIQTVVDQHVRRHDIRDVIGDPEAAHAVLPKELADLVSGPPTTRLVEPEYLSLILDQLEALT